MLRVRQRRKPQTRVSAWRDGVAKSATGEVKLWDVLKGCERLGNGQKGGGQSEEGWLQMQRSVQIKSWHSHTPGWWQAGNTPSSWFHTHATSTKPLAVSLNPSQNTAFGRATIKKGEAKFTCKIIKAKWNRNATVEQIHVFFWHSGEACSVGFVNVCSEQKLKSKY